MGRKKLLSMLRCCGLLGIWCDGDWSVRDSFSNHKIVLGSRLHGLTRFSLGMYLYLRRCVVMLSLLSCMVALSGFSISAVLRLIFVLRRFVCGTKKTRCCSNESCADVHFVFPAVLVSRLKNK
jgi:hypothetical protein